MPMGIIKGRLAPVCGLCRVLMRCVKNEQMVKDKPVDENPSTFWSGDTFACPVCHGEVILGFGGPMPANQLSPEEIKSAIAFDYEAPKEDAKQT